MSTQLLSSDVPLARWETDGGATRRPGSLASATTPTSARAQHHNPASVARFLGLSDVVEISGDDVAFPLGVRYPYTGHLRRVVVALDDVCGGEAGAANALLSSMAKLHEAIAFAPGPTGGRLADAFDVAQKALRSHPDGGSCLLLGDAPATDRRDDHCRVEAL